MIQTPTSIKNLLAKRATVIDKIYARHVQIRNVRVCQSKFSAKYGTV